MNDEIEALHRQIGALRDEVLALQDQLPVLTQTKPRVLTLAAQKLTLFDQWLQQFPSEGQFWELPGTALQCFDRARKQLRDLALFVGKRLGQSDPQTRMLWDVIALADRAREQVMTFLWSRHRVVPEESRSGFVLSSRQVFQVLKIHLWPWSVDWVAEAPEDEDARLVRFHPYLTIQLVYNLMDALKGARERNKPGGRLSWANTPDFFEVRMTIQGVRLRPDVWDSLYIMPHCYEALRDIGGHIEPLTWADGKDRGEGVILRLPWSP